MEKIEIITQIKEHISKNNTEEAFKCLANCQFKHGDEEVILLNSRFNKVQKEMRIGVLEREDGNRELIQINLAIINLTQFIKPFGDRKEKESKISSGQLDKTHAKVTTKIGTSNLQLDETIDKKTTKFTSSTTNVIAIELETTDRRVQNSDGVFRIETSVVLGRHPDCDIVIIEKGVSRHHARIFRQGDQMFISDENSTNGTFWNEQQISQMAATEDGTLRLDEIEFKLCVIKK